MMAPRVKITVSLDEAVVRALDAESRRRKIPRSRILEASVEAWQRLDRERALVDGYQALASENLKVAEENLGAAWELWK